MDQLFSSAKKWVRPFLGFLLTFTLVQLAFANMDSDFSGGGAIRIGDTTTTVCNGTTGGAIRFDASGDNSLDYCNGSAWVSLLTSSIGDAIVNGGNSFAAPMIIGTNDG